MQEETQKTILEKAKTILVALPKNPSIDEVAAGVALYLSFNNTDKKTDIVCETPLTVSYSSIVGVDKVKKDAGAKNLVLVFDWKEGATKTVTYDVVDEKFRFVIHPEQGKPPLDAETVQFSYEGLQADLIITIGASRLDELGTLYTQEKKVYSETPIINIDNEESNEKFGFQNHVVTEAASLSELVVDFMREQDLPVDVDIATNLLTGMSAATENFQSERATANTFEAAAACLAAGAKRIKVSKEKGEVTLPEHEGKEKTETGSKPSPDWFGPKIYKGSSQDTS